MTNDNMWAQSSHFCVCLAHSHTTSLFLLSFPPLSMVAHEECVKLWGCDSAQFADLHKLKALHQTLATNATALGETTFVSQKENRYIWSIAIQLKKILRYDFFSPALTQNSTFHVGASTDFSLSKKKLLLVCRH